LVDEGDIEIDIDGAIKIVICYFKWNPSVIDGFYCDREDYKGLFYWYDLVKELTRKK